jgi:hypothetical protein
MIQEEQSEICKQDLTLRKKEFTAINNRIGFQGFKSIPSSF